MPMEEALVARLAAAAPIAAEVDNRIDWFDRPNALSALTLTKASSGREYTLEGPDGLDSPRIQFDCWGATKAAVARLARAVLAEMERPASAGGWIFEPAFLELERWPDGPEDLAGGDKAFRVQMDFIFFHQPEEA